MPKKSQLAARRAGKPGRSKKGNIKKASYSLPSSDIPTPSGSGALVKEVSPRRSSPASVIRRPIPILPSEAECGYVVKDLAQIGVVAGSLMTAMVALAFLIR